MRTIGFLLMLMGMVVRVSAQDMDSECVDSPTLICGTVTLTVLPKACSCGISVPSGGRVEFDPIRIPESGYTDLIPSSGDVTVTADVTAGSCSDFSWGQGPPRMDDGANGVSLFHAASANGDDTHSVGALVKVSSEATPGTKTGSLEIRLTCS